MVTVSPAGRSSVMGELEPRSTVRDARQPTTSPETGSQPSFYPATIEPRFRYNQAFLSSYAIPPGVLMMQLIMIPAMSDTASSPP